MGAIALGLLVVVVAVVAFAVGGGSSKSAASTSTSSVTTTTADPMPAKIRTWYSQVSPDLGKLYAAVTKAKNAGDVSDFSAQCIANAEANTVALEQQQLPQPPNAELAVRWKEMVSATNAVTSNFVQSCSARNAGDYAMANAADNAVAALVAAFTSAQSDFQATMSRLTGGK